MLIDEARGRAAILEQALRDAGYQVVARLDSPSDVLAQIQATEPDVILIDMESPDRDTLEYLRAISRDRPKPIVMFAERSDSTTIEETIRAGVSAYIVDEVSMRRLKPILEVAIARFREFQALRRELDDARSKLAERKIVEKAKGLLMARRSMSEEQAYQALRKMAMDRNQRLAEVARSVIDVLELLG